MVYKYRIRMRITVFFCIIFTIGFSNHVLSSSLIIDQVEQEVEKLNKLLTEFEQSTYKEMDGYKGQLNEFGQKDGVGMLKLSNGDYHFGQWRKSIRHGLGLSYSIDTEDTYIGQFKFDNQHGLGKLTSGDGEEYVGEWIVGNQEGYGIYKWSDGSKYTGEWHDGNPHGVGTWENSELKYVGNWEDGKRHGNGKVIRKKDKKILYNGLFQNDRPAEKQ